MDINLQIPVGAGSGTHISNTLNKLSDIQKY